MISSKFDGKDLKLKDSADDFRKDYGESMYKTVVAALQAGLEEFTVPTPGDDEGRQHFKTRKWTVLVDGKLKVFLVAFPEKNAECEILGPEIKQKP